MTLISHCIQQASSMHYDARCVYVQRCYYVITQWIVRNRGNRISAHITGQVNVRVWPQTRYNIYQALYFIYRNILHMNIQLSRGGVTNRSRCISIFSLVNWQKQSRLATCNKGKCSRPMYRKIYFILSRRFDGFLSDKKKGRRNETKILELILKWKKKHIGNCSEPLDSMS